MSRLRSAFFALLVGAALAAPTPAAAQQRRCVVSQVVVSPPEVRVHVDSSHALVATAYDGAGYPCDQVAFVWSTSNLRVVTVDERGVATGVSVGMAIVTAVPLAGAARGGGQAIVVVSAPGCDDRREFLRNTGGACWDERARPLSVPFAEAPSACEGTVTTPVVLLRLASSGEVLDVELVRPSNCAAYSDSALAIARRSTWRPHRRGGEPVSGWLMMTVPPRPRRP